MAQIQVGELASTCAACIAVVRLLLRPRRVLYYIVYVQDGARLIFIASIIIICRFVDVIRVTVCTVISFCIACRSKFGCFVLVDGCLMIGSIFEMVWFLLWVRAMRKYLMLFVVKHINWNLMNIGGGLKKYLECASVWLRVSDGFILLNVFFFYNCWRSKMCSLVSKWKIECLFMFVILERFCPIVGFL